MARSVPTLAASLTGRRRLVLKRFASWFVLVHVFFCYATELSTLCSSVLRSVVGSESQMQHCTLVWVAAVDEMISSVAAPWMLSSPGYCAPAPLHVVPCRAASSRSSHGNASAPRARAEPPAGHMRGGGSRQAAQAGVGGCRCGAADPCPCCAPSSLMRLASYR